MPRAPTSSPTAPATRSRRTGRRERTRGRLLEAARVAFAGVGWNRARVEDVCREAGVGHGTFYAYFGNRTEILEALVRRHAAGLYTLVDAPWTSADGWADVRRVVAGYVRVCEADRDVREIWANAASEEPLLAALYDEVRGQFVDRVRRNLAVAVRRGVARPGLDVDVAANALAAMVEQTVAVAAAPTAAPVSADRLVETLTDLWVHAISAGSVPRR